MKNAQNETERLIQGIESFISRNRCSISTEDEVLLNECVAYLKESLKTNDSSKTKQMISDSLAIIIKIINVASHLTELLS